MSRRAYSRAAILQRLFNSPLQVLPDTASIVLGAIGNRFDVGQLFMAAEGRTLAIGELEDMAAGARIEIASQARVDQLAPKASANNLMQVIQSVAHIEVRGELVSENGIGPSSGFTGYDGIRAQIISADADASVRGLLVDINCPGGEVDQLYELTNMMMARRGKKPMRAVIRGCGASAAYAIAACADEITINPLGIAGSIGTIAMHADFSVQMEQEGVKVTLVMAGSHKADGNPFEPLPEAVRERISAMVNFANDQFIAHVAAARGLSPDDVRGQQAQIYRGEEAVGAGLVDKVMSWSDSIDEFAAQVNGGNQPDRAARSAPGARSQEQVMEYTQETQDAAELNATTAERTRIGALAELDAESTLSAGLTAAIGAGTSAGDFAIAMAKAAKESQRSALDGARADAAASEQLPEQRTDASADTKKPNRGLAAVERMTGKHAGLPART